MESRQPFSENRRLKPNSLAFFDLKEDRRSWCGVCCSSEVKPVEKKRCSTSTQCEEAYSEVLLLSLSVTE
ncbi:hypothetical protein LOK49_LG02G02561 [Camellia lanceoleosa]|uniref:Uncharacterized protein n=1 Tax=Camellia lanceoleosa TaxID=1840588 RepID=A0ACC0IKP8_9ERIC|nr:hypothetical protein LOK49_LG02G02561 [Camellia lanceoleosa]